MRPLHLPPSPQLTLRYTDDWNDNARDILNFLIYYLPSTAASPPLPTHLPRLPSPESNYRKTHGFAHRTLVVVGHSFGGCTSYVVPNSTLCTRMLTATSKEP